MPQSFSSPRFTGRDAAFLALLLIAVFAAFSPALGRTLTGDAFFLTYGNRFNASTEGLKAAVQSDFFAGRSGGGELDFQSGYYRPAVSAAFWLESRFAGRSDAVYIADELLLHWADASLVFVLARLLFPASQVIPFFASAVFALHPGNAFAATRVDSRGDAMFLLFYLLSVVAYIRAFRGSSRPRAAAYLGSLIFAGLALSSKESAVTLPAALLLLHLYWRGTAGRPLRDMVWSVPHWCVLAVYFYLRGMVVGLLPASPYLQEYPAHIVMLNAVKSVGIYLARAFFPFGAEYDILLPRLVNRIDPQLKDPPIYASLLLLMIAAGFAAARTKKSPLPSFLVFFFLLSIAPLAGIARVSTVMDLEVIDVPERFFYLPLVPLLFLSGMGVEGFVAAVRGPWARRMLFGFAVAGLVLLCAASYRHSLAVNSDLAVLNRLYLFDDAGLSKNERMRKLVMYADFIDLKMGNTAGAERRCKDALALNPHSPIPAATLARVYALEKRWAEVFRVLSPWLNLEGESMAEMRAKNRLLSVEYISVVYAVDYYAGLALMHNGQARAAADLMCEAVKTGYGQTDIRAALRLNYALNGPPRCLGNGAEMQCAEKAEIPDFPGWRLPLDAASCGRWKDLF